MEMYAERDREMDPGKFEEGESLSEEKDGGSEIGLCLIFNQQYPDCLSSLAGHQT